MTKVKHAKTKQCLPSISIIVIFYNMIREAPRTLYTLTSGYQNVDEKDYEVIAIDNGSTSPLDEEMVCSMGSNFRYINLENAPPSPALALNEGARFASGRLLGFMVDGARMLSPGILKYTLHALRAFHNPVVYTLGFHLGPDFQPKAIEQGYDQKQEDKLLKEINWRENGYKLFDISVFAGSSEDGWLTPVSESNCIFLTGQQFHKIGGFNEAFDFAGGGFLNLEFFYRVCMSNSIELVRLLGEGSFHQVHGGAMTGKTREQMMTELIRLHAQHQEILGFPLKPPLKPWHYLGHIPKSVNKSLHHSSNGLKSFLERAPDVSSVFQQDESPFHLQDSTDEQRVIIILGMHRSGTSMLAGTLRESGVAMGDVFTHAPHNLKGNMEHPAIMHMQEDILVANGGSWLAPPPNVNWNNMQKSVRDLFVSSLEQEAIWGFKDPRTLFTYEGWLEILDNPEFVGIFRHPLLVAVSLRKRNNFSIEKGLELWMRYNEELLKLHDKAPFPLIEFHEDTTILQDKLKELVELLELPKRYRHMTFFDSSLKSSKPEDFELPAEIIELYQQLMDRSI